MNRCHRYQDLIESCLADQITSADRADLDEHCTACAECAGQLTVHRNLLELGNEIPLPGQLELRDMREAVLAATGERKPADNNARSRAGFLADLGRLWRTHPLPAGLATAAVLVGAVLLGRGIPQDHSLERALMQQSNGWATVGAASLDEYLDSPFSFANVSVRHQEQERLALSFDVSRHVDMLVAQDSPLAREVLLQAILEPSSLGSRLRAMKVTPQLRDDRLKEALVATMLDDPDPAVRINALAVLAQYPYDQHSQDALIQTLRQDQDVQMRLTALDELARQNVGLETIRNAVGDDDPNGTMALLHQAAMKF